MEPRFHDIAWAPAKSDQSKGLIAGGLENGSLCIWDAERLLTNAGYAHFGDREESA